MARKPMTIEQLIAKTDDGTLLDIQEELLSGVVPATGAAHSFIRHVNRMIDRGDLCINPTTYRKVYLPTLAKMVQREMAARYVRHLKGQQPFISDIDQLTLDLVAASKQVGPQEVHD